MLKCVVSVDSWRELEGRGMKEGVGAMSSEMVLKAYGKDKGIIVMDMQERMSSPSSLAPELTNQSRVDWGTEYFAASSSDAGRSSEYLLHFWNDGEPQGMRDYAQGLDRVSHFRAPWGQDRNGRDLLLFSPRTCSSSSSTFCHATVALFESSRLTEWFQLSHIYERFCEDAALSVGMPIGYSCGDPLRILEDCQTLHPTSFVTVPRVLNRLYQSIKAATIDQPGLRGAMCRRAVKDKIERYRRTGEVKHGIWDRLIFDKISKVLGGKVDFILTGSAPINPDVLTFLKVRFDPRSLRVSMELMKGNLTDRVQGGGD